MTDLQKELDGALRILSAIPVNGDGVEYMAAAKQHLRKAFELAGKVSEDEGRQDG